MSSDAPSSSGDDAQATLYGTCPAARVDLDSGCSKNGTQCTYGSLADQIAVPLDAGGDAAGAVLGSAWGLAQDATHVYWTARRSADPAGWTGSVLRVSKSTRSVDRLVDGEDAPYFIAVDDTWVYWLTEPANGVRKLRRSKKACHGCAVESLLDVPDVGNLGSLIALGPQDLLVGRSAAFFRYAFDGVTWSKGTVHSTHDYPSATFDGRRVFTANGRESTIYELPPDLALRSAFATFPSDADVDLGPFEMTSDCDRVYAAAGGSRFSIFRFATASGADASAEMVVEQPTTAIAADEQFLYVGLYNGGGIYRLRKGANGGTPLRVVQADVWLLLVDDQAVYFAGRGYGGVQRMLK